MSRSAFAVILFALLLVACGGGGEPAPTPTPTATDTPTPTPTSTPVPTPTATPTVVIPSAEPAGGISLPPGFTAYIIASDLNLPTSVALSPGGAIYVAQLNEGVLRLDDSNGDGILDERTLFTPGFGETNGIAFSEDNTLYIASRGQVTTAADSAGDGVADLTSVVVDGLPNGAHQANGMAFGPDGKLYITNGSTCDECIQADERSATILQANPDGSELRVFASGLRNPYDLAFDARGRLWATDNGSDGGEFPFCASIDELNLIEDGNDYGWPYGTACDPFASGTPPVASLGLHTGSTGIDAYDAGHFPAEYRGDLFLTLWGTFEFESDTPQGLYRARVGDSGGALSVEIEEFGLGFVRPIDVVTDRDGTLLVLDFGGALYRIVYTGP